MTGIMPSQRLCGGPFRLFARIGKGTRAACKVNTIHVHISWSSCRLRLQHGHSAATISDGGGHRRNRETPNKPVDYSGAPRATVTPNKKCCWFFGQCLPRLSWAAGQRRHDQNQVSPPSGDDEFALWLPVIGPGRMPTSGAECPAKDYLGVLSYMGRYEATNYKGFPLVVSSILWNEAPSTPYCMAVMNSSLATVWRCYILKTRKRTRTAKQLRMRTQGKYKTKTKTIGCLCLGCVLGHGQ